MTTREVRRMDDEDEGRDTPPLYRGGVNVAKPPKKPNETHPGRPGEQTDGRQ
jgi:hypothetical protein